MADVLDVQNKIVNDIIVVTNPLAGTTYHAPEAVDDGFAGPQTCGAIQVFPGKQLLRTIMTRLELGKNQIGVSADEHELKMGQYIDLPTYQPVNASAPTPGLSIATSSNGTVCTISGTIQAGDVIGVTLGAKGASYAVVGTDTLTTIAASLASNASSAGIMASSTGAQVTISSPGEPQFSVGTSYTIEQEVWRRRKIFYADLHACTPYEMQYIGRNIESMYTLSQTLLLPVDGTYARVLSMDTIDFTEQQRDGAYLRRFRWLIDFVTTQQYTATQVVAVMDNLTVQATGTNVTFTPPTPSQL